MHIWLRIIYHHHEQSAAQIVTSAEMGKSHRHTYYIYFTDTDFMKSELTQIKHKLIFQAAASEGTGSWIRFLQGTHLG